MTKKPKKPYPPGFIKPLTEGEKLDATFAEMQAKSKDMLVKSLSIPVDVVISVEPGSSALLDAVKEQWASTIMTAALAPTKNIGPYTKTPMTLFKSLEHSPLVKADSGNDYGAVDGQKIIAIGPKGGKIVGYDIHHDPIYAGTPKAKKLAAVKEALTKDPKFAPPTHPDLHVLGKEWLEALGIQPTTFTTTAATITAKDAGPLHSEYGITVHSMSAGLYAIKWSDVVQHMGHPLVPHPSKLAIAAHNLASGVPSNHVFPESTFATLKITVADLGGTHHPAKAEDKSGKEFVWKTNKTLGEHALIASWAEEVFSRVANLVALEPDNYPKAEMGSLAGIEGCLLEFKDNKSTIGGGPKGANVPEGALKKYAKQLAQSHVLDWLMANHDAHGGNFLITPDEKGLIPVDKGQAFKFVGHDMLDVGYHPNQHEPVYNKLWKMVQAGKFSAGAVAEIIQAVKAQVQHVSDNLSLEQYQAIVWPYLEAGESQDEWKSAEKWALIKKRYQNLAKDFETFLSGITGQTVQFDVAPPALSVVEKPAKPAKKTTAAAEAFFAQAVEGAKITAEQTSGLKAGMYVGLVSSLNMLPVGSTIKVGHGLAETELTKWPTGKWGEIGQQAMTPESIIATWKQAAITSVAPPTIPEGKPTIDLSKIAPADKTVVPAHLLTEGFLSSVDYGTVIVLPTEHFTKEAQHWVDAKGNNASSKTLALYLKHEATGGVNATFLTSTVAAKAKDAVPEAPAPKLAVQQMPGWPQSKGKPGATTTVHHPGTSPAPGVKWDAKYPGPGFKADAEYKGQKFTYEFGVKDGGPLVTVTFPDGSVKTTTNFAEAGDWVQLLEHGAPLSITSSMKKFGFYLDDSGTPQAFNKNNFDEAKAFKSKVTGKPLKGVSYTLTKLLKLEEFDFAGAGSAPTKAELPDAAKTVTQLENEHKVAPAQKTLSEHAVLSAFKGEVVTDKSALPFAIQAALAEVPTGALPAGWNLPIAPGTIFLDSEKTVDDSLFIYMAKHVDGVGAVLQSWNLKPDGSWDGSATGQQLSPIYSAHTVNKSKIYELADAKAMMDEAKKHTTTASAPAKPTVPDAQAHVVAAPPPVSTADIIPETGPGPQTTKASGYDFDKAKVGDKVQVVMGNPTTKVAFEKTASNKWEDGFSTYSNADMLELEDAHDIFPISKEPAASPNPVTVADFAALPVGTKLDVTDSDGDDLGPYTKTGTNLWMHSSSLQGLTDAHLAKDVDMGLTLTVKAKPEPAAGHAKVTSNASPVVMTEQPELFVEPSLVPAFTAMLANKIPDDVFNKKHVKIEQGYLAHAPADDTPYEVVAMNNGTSTHFMLMHEPTKKMIGIADAEPLATNMPSADLAALLTASLVASAKNTPGTDFSPAVGGAIATAVQHILSHAGGVAPPVQNVIEETGAVPESEAKKMTTAKMPASQVITTKLEPHLKDSGVLSGKALIALKPSNGGDTMLSVTIKSGNLTPGKTKHEVASELHKFLSKHGIIAKKIGASTFSDGAYAYLHPSQVEQDITIEVPLEEAVNIAPSPPPTGFDGKTLQEVWGSLPLNEPLWFETASGKKQKFVVTAEMGKKPQIAIEGSGSPPTPSSKVFSHPNAWKPGEFGAKFEDIPVGSEFILFKSVPGGSPIKVFAKKVDFDKVVTDVHPAPFKLPPGFDTFAPHNFVTKADLDSAPQGATFVVGGPSASLSYTKGPAGWTYDGLGASTVVPVESLLAVATGIHSDGANPGNALQAHKLIIPEAQPAAQKALAASFAQGSKITKQALTEHASEIPHNGYFAVLSADGEKKYSAQVILGQPGVSWFKYEKVPSHWNAAGFVWAKKSYTPYELPEGEYTIVEGGVVDAPTPTEIPGKISKTMKKEEKVDLLNTLPVGTQITHESGTWTLLHYTAISDTANKTALWKNDDGTQIASSYTLVHYKSKFGGPVTPPNGVAGVQAKAKSTAKAKSDVASNVFKAQAYKPKPVDPELAAKAKVWSDWLKAHPPVQDDATLIALGKAQADGKLHDAFVFQGVAGQILVGENTGSLDALKGEILPAVTGEMQTPVGKMLIVDAKHLQSLYPTKLVDGINEHAGKKFPEGTKFKTKEVVTSKLDALKEKAPGVYVKDHNTDENLSVVKFPQGSNTVESANEALAAIGVSVKAGKGNVNHVAMVPKGALDGVHKTETVTTPVIPETPTWKQSSVKGAPVMGPQAKWQPHTANKGDLSSMESIKPGIAGHFIRCGDPAFLAGCRLQVKKVKGTDGKITYEVFGTATQFDEAKAKAAGCKKGEVGFMAQSCIDGHYDANTGHHTPEFEASSYKALTNTLSGSGDATLWNGPDYDGGVYNGTFRIRIPEGSGDLESRIAEGLIALGLDPAKMLADHATDPDLESRWVKQELLHHALGCTGVVQTAKKNESLIAASVSHGTLDQMLNHTIGKASSKSKVDEILSTAQIVTGSAGEPRVRFDYLNVSGLENTPLVTKADLDNIHFITSGVSKWSLALFAVEAGLQTSNKFGKMMGTAAPQGPGIQASAEMDENKSGAFGTYAAVAYKSMDSIHSCQADGEVRIMYAKEVLATMPSSFFNSDGMGSLAGGSSKKATKASGTGNEVIVHDFLPMEFAVGVACKSESIRNKMLASWKKKHPEQTEINGIAVEDFFFNADSMGQDTGHIGACLTKCKGLKKASM